MPRSLFSLVALVASLILLASPSTCAEDPPVLKPFEEKLEDLHLLTPPWRSQTIYRESIIPLQFEENGPITGRLAFEAVEILAVRSADGKQQLKLGTDIRLSDDRRTLIFTPSENLPLIKQSEFYPAPDSPNSYRHRLGHPDQWLLYSQGHWWHDHQYEVTYRRADDSWSGPIPKLAEQRLPKSFARLRAKQPLSLGVSGDSITFGLNA